MDYLFAFLHGFLHPLLLLPLAQRKPYYLAGCLSLGMLTLAEFFLLTSLSTLGFLTIKLVLAMTMAAGSFLILMWPHWKLAIGFGLAAGASIDLVAAYITGPLYDLTHELSWLGIGLPLLFVLQAITYAIFGVLGFYCARRCCKPLRRTS